MSFEFEFLDMMPHRVTIEGFTGYDIHGDPLPPGPAAVYQCLISGKDISLRRTMDEQDAIIFDIYIGARVESDGGGGETLRPVQTDMFLVNDRVTLPADQAFRDTHPVIFAVGHLTDENGPHHVKLQCGWMYHRQGQ